MTWQDRVRTLMKKSRHTNISELAGAAGISQGSLNMAMNGKHIPKSSTMDKLADVLGTTSQYILYGEQQAPAQTVPVLSTDRVGLWLMKQILMEDCEIITAPDVLGDMGFAWRADVIDMVPLFPKGAIVFFEACSQQEMARADGSNYVLAAMVHRNRDLASTKGPHHLELIESILNITSPVFRELVRTGQGVSLNPIDTSYDRLPLEPMEIIARARYCLVNVSAN